MARWTLALFAANILVAGWHLTPAQAGIDPLLDKVLELKQQSQNGEEMLRGLVAKSGLEFDTVIDFLDNKDEQYKLLADQILALQARGRLEKRGLNGDQYYIFDESSGPGDRGEALVIEQCLSDLGRFFSDLQDGVFYARRMRAAASFIPENPLIVGRFIDPGNYWLCSSTKKDTLNETNPVPPFDGRYCYAGLALGLIGWGTCWPSTCSEEDVNVISWILFNDVIGLDVGIYLDCTEPSPWTTAEIAFTATLSVIAFLVLVGTFYEIFLQDVVIAKLRHTEAAHHGHDYAAAQKPSTKVTPVSHGDRDSVIATSSADGGSIDEGEEASSMMGKDQETLVEEGKVNGGFQAAVGEMEEIVLTTPSQIHLQQMSMETAAEKMSKNKYGGLPWAILHALMLSFSVVNNGRKILSAKKNKNTMGVLNGLRVISMFWVILGHSLQFILLRTDNAWEIVRDATGPGSFGYLAIINAAFSVDTFFVLSGFLVAFLTLKAMDGMYEQGNDVDDEKKTKAKQTSTSGWAKFWGLFYFHRWWRLTPVYMAAMGIWALLFPHFGLGINQDGFYDYATRKCRNTWWTHPLYINNLYPWPNSLDEMCMEWTWYLANDMQFFIISPFILVLLYKNWKAGMALITSLMLVSLGSLFSLNWYYGYVINRQDPYNENVPEDPEADVVYAKPYTRIPTYLVGMVIGYIIWKLKGRKLKIKLPIVLAGWLVCLVCLFFPVYGTWFSSTRTDLPQATAVSYLTFSQLSWGVGVGWVIFACLQGYGAPGPIDAFLGWSFWIPLARLTYCAYLIHPVIIYSKIFTDKVLSHITYVTLAYLFVGNLVFSYLSSLILSLLIEAPTMGLEKIFFGKFKKKF